jgi:hypothetical protein
MLDDDVKLVRVNEERIYDATLTPTVSVRVEFMVGKHGPFVEKFPKADYTALQRDDRLNAFAREVR